MVRVTILINELLLGGAQRIVLDIMRGIDREHFALEVVYLKSHKNFGARQTLLEDACATGIPVVSLEGKERFHMRDMLRLYQHLRRTRPDIVHTFLPYAGILGRIAGRLSGVSRIVSTQGNLPAAYGKKIYWLDRLTLFLARAWIGATEGIELAYAGSSAPFSRVLWREGRRHYTILAGVDLPRFDGRLLKADRERMRRELAVPEGAPLVMMIARFVSWKGHADLIAALLLLPPSVHLALVGWGPLEAKLREEVRRAGLSSRVHFLISRSDIPELLCATDVYVQAHARDPHGRIWVGPNTSQMEACAAGVPSVSTAVPLIERLIEDGVTGIVAKPNDPRDLARAIKTLLDDKGLTKRLAENARTRVKERFSTEAMVRAHEELYAALVARSS